MPSAYLFNMASGPTFQLPTEFEVPPSSDGEDFETLATIRRMPDGTVKLVALDGTEFLETPTPEDDEEAVATNESELPGGPISDDASAMEAIESRLEGVPPSEITL